jgi:hypothetical protein
MSEETPVQEMTRKTVLYKIPGMEEVQVRRDEVYRETATIPLIFDLYTPPGERGEENLPVVVLVAGYPDPGLRRFVGCSFKEMGSTVSWARLIAASGMAAIAYTNREPVPDLDALFEFVWKRGAELGLDPSRIGIWASSGNAALGLTPLLRAGASPVRCAALLYGCLLDLDGATGMAEMARQFGFASPGAGRSIDDLDPSVPLFLARAGREHFPHLNETMERFLAAALARNLPVTFVNHPEGPHAFDLEHDSERTRGIVRQTLEFLRFHLRG